MSRRWTDKQLKQLRPGMVDEKQVKLPQTRPQSQQAAESQGASTGRETGKTTVKKIPRPEAPELREMKTWLRTLKIDFVPEFRFHPKRQWRFDIALPDHKLAVEYEGIFGDKEHNGHTSVQHYIKDTQKYNAAVLQGWRVLRYTSNNYQKEFLRDIADILNIKTV